MADPYAPARLQGTQMNPAGGGKGGAQMSPAEYGMGMPPEAAKDPSLWQRHKAWSKDNPQFYMQLASSISNMGMRPNQGLQAGANQAMRRKSAMDYEKESGNKTADRVEAMGYPEQAKAIRANPQMAGQIYRQVWEHHNKAPEETYSTVQGGEIPGGDPSAIYNRSDTTGKLSRIGSGPQVQVNTGGGETSAGMEAYQKDIASKVADWQGSRPVFESNIEKLNLSAKALIDGEAKPGTAFGNLPGFLQKMYDEPTAQTMALAQDAVGSSLRETLGAQFTEKEGERILNNVFDPRLSPEQNIQRLSILIAQMNNVMAAKDEINQAFFDTQGTMQGFRPSVAPVTASSIIEAMGGEVGGIGNSYGDGTLESEEELRELERLRDLEAAQGGAGGIPPGGRRRASR